jgi:hypothetical protein
MWVVEFFHAWTICSSIYNCAWLCFCRGDAARKAAAATAEAAAQQQAVMAAVEAETKQEVVVEPAAVSQVMLILAILNAKLSIRFTRKCQGIY